MNSLDTDDATLRVLSEAPFIAADRMLVKYLREAWGESDPWVLRAVALCSLAAREGHAYLDLELPRAFGSIDLGSWPSLGDWQASLKRSPICSREGKDRTTPLVLVDGHSLYLEKYYQFERSLASRLRGRLKHLEPSDNASVVDRASQAGFFIITGGPGTGKTTLALSYLDRLLSQWAEQRPPRLAAVAPTGKAAARLAESLAQGVARSKFAPQRREQLLQVPCLTIHRMLGALPHRSRFRRNEQSPVRFDAIVIDESSMVDLPLMLRLFEALPLTCKVLMLGDKDQLSSVDVGSVFSDLLEAAAAPNTPLASVVERLNKTYRFSEDSAIYQACQAAREGATEAFEQLLAIPGEDFVFHEEKALSSRIPSSCLRQAHQAWQRLAACGTPLEALARLNEWVTLTPTRSGPWGAVAFNRHLERLAHEASGSDPLGRRLPHACPLIVLENDYERGLFNGDLGLLWVDEARAATACFLASDGSLRAFRPNELPRHESAFALTIHKSQGSEFSEIACLFHSQSKGNLTRELVYTALSRARAKVSVWGDKETLLGAIARKANRATRLAILLNR